MFLKTFPEEKQGEQIVWINVSVKDGRIFIWVWGFDCYVERDTVNLEYALSLGISKDKII